MTLWNYDPNCPFCRIIKGIDYADMVWESPDTIAFIPLNPVTVGHVLFVPRVHVLDARISSHVTGTTFARAAEWGDKRRVPFNLITSTGPEATQSIKHLHVHFVPRSFDDGLSLPWTP